LSMLKAFKEELSIVTVAEEEYVVIGD